MLLAGLGLYLMWSLLHCLGMHSGSGGNPALGVSGLLLYLDLSTGECPEPMGHDTVMNIMGNKEREIRRRKILVGSRQGG